MTKYLSFLHLRAVFVSYCPQFWVFGVIFKAHDAWYLFDRHDQKLIVFAFMAIFVSYFPLFGFWGIYMARDTQYMFERHDQKLVIFAFYDHFHELLPTVLGFRGDLQGP
jgi:hypothetical protein